MEKKCSKCEVVKSLDDFGNDKYSKDSKNGICKICKNLYAKVNKEKFKKYYKQYSIENKEKAKDYNKKNKLKIKKYRQEYRKKNLEIIKEKKRLYYQNNKKQITKKRSEYRSINIKKITLYKKENKPKRNKQLTLRRNIDPLFKLRCNIKNSICNSLRKQGYSKKTKTYNMLKCEYTFFMEWLNGLASNGYTYGIGDLHLDHVVPISLAQTEDEILLLSHYSNYQLLSADENLAKSNRYVNPLNLARVLEHHPEPNKIKEIYSRL
jgi:hypothetical protein